MSTRTSLWLIRHAPVLETRGKIYGKADVNCVCDDEAQFHWLARVIPSETIFVTSGLRRTVQTAEAVQRAGHGSEISGALADLNEQSFGGWEGLSHQEVRDLFGANAIGFWAAPATKRPAEDTDDPGESFYDLCIRVSGALEHLVTKYSGQQVAVFAHGGTIRACLAMAFGLLDHKNPERLESIFAAQVKNLSLSRIDHIAGKPKEYPNFWQVKLVNALMTPKA